MRTATYENLINELEQLKAIEDRNKSIDDQILSQVPVRTLALEKGSVFVRIKNAEFEFFQENAAGRENVLPFSSIQLSDMYDVAEEFKRHAILGQRAEVGEWTAFKISLEALGEHLFRNYALMRSLLDHAMGLPLPTDWSSFLQRKEVCSKDQTEKTIHSSKGSLESQSTGTSAVLSNAITKKNESLVTHSQREKVVKLELELYECQECIKQLQEQLKNKEKCFEKEIAALKADKALYGSKIRSLREEWKINCSEGSRNANYDVLKNLTLHSKTKLDEFLLLNPNEFGSVELNGIYLWHPDLVMRFMVDFSNWMAFQSVQDALNFTGLQTQMFTLRDKNRELLNICEAETIRNSLCKREMEAIQQGQNNSIDISSVKLAMPLTPESSSDVRNKCYLSSATVDTSESPVTTQTTSSTTLSSFPEPDSFYGSETKSSASLQTFYGFGFPLRYQPQPIFYLSRGSEMAMDYLNVLMDVIEEVFWGYNVDFSVSLYKRVSIAFELRNRAIDLNYEVLSYHAAVEAEKKAIEQADHIEGLLDRQSQAIEDFKKVENFSDYFLYDIKKRLEKMRISLKLNKKPLGILRNHPISNLFEKSIHESLNKIISEIADELEEERQIARSSTESQRNNPGISTINSIRPVAARTKAFPFLHLRRTRQATNFLNRDGDDYNSRGKKPMPPSRPVSSPARTFYHGSQQQLTVPPAKISSNVKYSPLPFAQLSKSPFHYIVPPTPDTLHVTSTSDVSTSPSPSKSYKEKRATTYCNPPPYENERTTSLTAITSPEQNTIRSSAYDLNETNNVEATSQNSLIYDQEQVTIMSSNKIPTMPSVSQMAENSLLPTVESLYSSSTTYPDTDRSSTGPNILMGDRNYSIGHHDEHLYSPSTQSPLQL